MPPWSYFNFHSDVSDWIELRRLLKAGLEDVPASEWRPGVQVPKPGNPLGESAHYRAELRKAYTPYGTEVCAACGERFLDGVWPTMEAPVAYWSRVSVRQAAWYAAGLCPCPDDDGEYMTVFPFPDASVKEVAAWFTTEWWCAVGYEYHLGYVTSDPVIFAHQFKH